MTKVVFKDDFEDGDMDGWENICNVDEYGLCADVVSTSSDFYGKPLSDYGMNGDYCVRVGRLTDDSVSSAIRTTVTIPSSGKYRLRFKYLVYGSGGYDSRDIAQAVAKLAGNTVFTQRVSYKEEYTGEFVSDWYSFNAGDSVEIYLAIERVQVYGGWLDNRYFFVDDVILEKEEEGKELVDSISLTDFLLNRPEKIVEDSVGYIESSTKCLTANVLLSCPYTDFLAKVITRRFVEKMMYDGLIKKIIGVGKEEKIMLSEHLSWLYPYYDVDKIIDKLIAVLDQLDKMGYELEEILEDPYIVYLIRYMAKKMSGEI